MNHNRAKEIFLAALDLPETQRPAFIAEACAGDAILRRAVDDLLAAHAAVPIFDSVHQAAPTIGVPITEGPGTRIGPYKLLQKIGEGGFGAVFMADQESPVHRRVALKIIKLGMDTRLVVARFEAERQALALMNHPHIAKVFDGGATESGRPYFVMEYVKGEPVTDYADRNSLSIPDRLALFSQVCQAIQHAHTKGVMHRDIKPSNVIVSTLDGRPHAKIIDFGIAKATDYRLTDKTLFTEHHMMIGTPAYMSPEQAEGSVDIDTRTDIYSLGVLLYELLTGTPPFDPRKLRSAAEAEMKRIIREVDPPKPSTRLSSLEDNAVHAPPTQPGNAEASSTSRPASSLDQIARMRKTEARKLGSIIRGELDWIVMKALEKDRGRRYQTASAFADDVQRHLTGQPVIAAPPGMAYRAKKFVRVHRWSVGLASAVVFAVFCFALYVNEKQLGKIERDNADLQSKIKDNELATRESELAMTLLRIGKGAEAKAFLEKSLSRSRANFLVLINSANSYVDKFKVPPHSDEDAQLANARLDEAAALEPNRPEPFNMRAIVLREQGRIDEAIATLNKGIALQPAYYPTHVTLAITLFRARRWDEALKSLEYAATLQGTEGDTRPWLRWHNLAAIDLALANPRAIQDIESALKEKGSRANLNVRLLEARIALAFPALGSADRGMQLALMADDLAGGIEYETSDGHERGLSKRILALAYLKKENWAKAAECADQAINLKDPCPAIPNLIAATAYRGLNRPADAEARRKAVQCDCLTKLKNDSRGLAAEIPGGVAWIDTMAELKALEN